MSSNESTVYDVEGIDIRKIRNGFVAYVRSRSGRNEDGIYANDLEKLVEIIVDTFSRSNIT